MNNKISNSKQASLQEPQSSNRNQLLQICKMIFEIIHIFLRKGSIYTLRYIFNLLIQSSRRNRLSTNQLNQQIENQENTQIKLNQVSQIEDQKDQQNYNQDKNNQQEKENFQGQSEQTNYQQQENSFQQIQSDNILESQDKLQNNKQKNQISESQLEEQSDNISKQKQESNNVEDQQESTEINQQNQPIQQNQQQQQEESQLKNGKEIGHIEDQQQNIEENQPNQLLLEQQQVYKQDVEDQNQNPIKPEPEPKINIKNQLLQIAGKSYKQRQVEIQYQQFVGECNDIKQTIKQYFGRRLNQYQEQIKNLKKEIIGHYNIRGDGNCFYTSFIFQYLSLLFKNQERKIQFLKDIDELKVSIQYQNIRIDQNQEIVKEFIYQFQQINTIEELLMKFRNPDQLFYLLSVIVFKNYFAQIFKKNPIIEIDDKNILTDILTWEQECNNNEILIKTISQFLKLHVILYFIDIKHNNYEKKEYMPEEFNQIGGLDKLYFLLAPGHYQIAIPK